MSDIVNSQSAFSQFSALDVEHINDTLKVGNSVGTDSRPY